MNSKAAILIKPKVVKLGSIFRKVGVVLAGKNRLFNFKIEPKKPEKAKSSKKKVWFSWWVVAFVGKVYPYKIINIVKERKKRRKTYMGLEMRHVSSPIDPDVGVNVDGTSACVVVAFIRKVYSYK
jgi:hypothetical protein